MMIVCHVMDGDHPSCVSHSLSLSPSFPSEMAAPCLSPKERGIVGGESSGSEEEEEEENGDEALLLPSPSSASVNFTMDLGSISRRLQKSIHSLKRPVVLLAGSSGSGKSSVLNAVFGKEVASTGVGAPVTQCTERYESEHVVIYDVKGLEHGRADDYVEEMQRFLAERTAEGQAEGRIHLVWYVVDAASSRFQVFEGTLCKSLFDNLPIIFLLNKRDLCSSDDCLQLRGVIEGLDIPRMIGIFETVASPDPRFFFPSTCPACHSDDLIIKIRTKAASCEACGHAMTVKPAGLDEVVAATVEALPKMAREAFVSAQEISMHQKDLMAVQIIREHVDHVRRGKEKDAGRRRRLEIFRDELIEMSSRLAHLWGFTKSSTEIGAHRGQCLLEEYSSFLRRLQLNLVPLSSHVRKAKARLGAEGISLHWSFRERYLLLMGRIAQHKSTAGVSSPSSIDVGFQEEVVEDKRWKRTFEKIVCGGKDGLDVALQDLLHSTDTERKVPSRAHSMERTVSLQPLHTPPDRRPTQPPTSKDPPMRFHRRSCSDSNMNELKNQTTSRGPSCVFGVPLDSKTIPPLVDQCVEHLLAKALHVVGLFRIPGSLSTIATLRNSLDQGEPLHLTEEHDPFTVAGLLKLYLQELPDPLFTHGRYRSWLEAVQRPGKEDRLVHLAAIAGTLPYPNHALLSRLFHFFKVLHEHSCDNKMPYNNLAIVLAPSLLRPPPDLVSFHSVLEDSPLVIRVVEHCILFPKQIFAPDDSTSLPEP